jgi:hypothetical protein
VRGVLLLPDGRREPLRLMLDLGAKAPLLVSEPFAARVGLTSALCAKVVSPLGAGVGGETHYAFARAPRVELGPGGPALADVLTGISVGGSLRGGSYDALVGAPFLAQFRRIAFDGLRNELVLARTPRRDQSRFDASGLFIVAVDGPPVRLRVSEVAPASAGALTDILADDEIVALDGVSTEQLGLPAVRSRLSAAGATVQVTLRRDAARRTVRLTLRDRLAPCPLPCGRRKC